MQRVMEKNFLSTVTHSETSWLNLVYNTPCTDCSETPKMMGNISDGIVLYPSVVSIILPLITWCVWSAGYLLHHTQGRTSTCCCQRSVTWRYGIWLSTCSCSGVLHLPSPVSILEPCRLIPRLSHCSVLIAHFPPSWFWSLVLRWWKTKLEKTWKGIYTDLVWYTWHVTSCLSQGQLVT